MREFLGITALMLVSGHDFVTLRHTKNLIQCVRESRGACPELVERGRLNFRPVQIEFEKRLGSATTLYGTVALSFVIPSEAEGSAVPRTSPGNAEY
jgi:hypothetical protein